MRGTWGAALALGLVLTLQLPAMGRLGMSAEELSARYPWEAGPEGTRLYLLGETRFSPILAAGRMVGAIAELPPGSTETELMALLLAMTEGLRQAPARERGSLAASTWERRTPDYQAMARREGDTLFLLIQQTPPDQRESPPAETVEVPLYRAQNDLEILQMALESYRARHFFRYPEVKTMDALLATLKRSEVLPMGFRLMAPVTEFGVWRTGYRISVSAGGETVTIRQPERWDPFWQFWQIRPFP